MGVIKKGADFVSEKITGKSSQNDEKDFVQSTRPKTPDEQSLLSPFERGVEPEFAYVSFFFLLSLSLSLCVYKPSSYVFRYEDTAIDNITGTKPQSPRE